MKKIGPILRYAALVLIALFFIFPVIWMLVTSLKLPVDAKDCFRFSAAPQFSNYVDAWQTGGFGKSFVNTLLISIGTVRLSLFAGFLAAYALMRSPISDRVKGFFNRGVNSMRIIPEMVFLIPLFVRFAGL